MRDNEKTEPRRNMRAERARNGLTMQQVADALHVHMNAVVRWENGSCEPRASHLVALCRLYGCTPEYLLDMTDERNGRAVACMEAR